MKGFRVIIVREGEGSRPRQWFFSVRVVRLIVAALMGSILVVALSLVLVFKFSLLSYRYNLLRTENKILKEENSRVVELRERLKEMREYRKKIAMLLGIEPDTMDLKSVFLYKGRKSGYRNRREELMKDSPYVPQGMPTEGIYSRGFSLFHPAVDIVAPYHAPVIATASGIVKEAGWDSILGNYVVIKHGEKYKTVYGHLARITVEKGKFVSRGDLIGFVGNTGQSTGPHLHYEVWEGGKRVDPRRFINLASR